jgi:DNA-binding CsgD family transcriptional regulator
MLSVGTIHDLRPDELEPDSASAQHLGEACRARSQRARREPRTVCGWESLTDTERRVANLVADGLTNREVGQRMYLSHHTVDFHLRHIYLKLHINSRVQLTRLVVEEGRGPDDRPSHQPPHWTRDGERESVDSTRASLRVAS